MPPQGRLADKAQAEKDAHGCPACPHSVVGPAIQGSPNVLVNNMPALRLGDPGSHPPCCGGNSWTAAAGSGTVLINNKPAPRVNDQTQHCGGPGKVVEGRPDVIVGG